MGVGVVALQHSDASGAQGLARMAKGKGELPAALKLRACWGTAPTAGGCLEPKLTSMATAAESGWRHYYDLTELSKAAESACEKW